MSEFELFVAMLGGSYLTTKGYPQILTKVKSDAKVFSSRKEASNEIDFFRTHAIADYKNQINKSKKYMRNMNPILKNYHLKKKNKQYYLKLKNLKN